jgi:alpha-L-rhamnosidase
MNYRRASSSRNSLFPLVPSCLVKAKPPRRAFAPRFFLPLLALLPFFTSCNADSPGPDKVVNLRCEYRVDPLGIDQTQPRLSWMIESGKQGEQQVAYQIVASSSPLLLAKEQADLWDSGKVESSKSNQIEYAGKPLTSLAHCFWKVRVWTSALQHSENDAQPLAWSAAGEWSMGLLNADDWQAKWITHGQIMPDESQAYPALDKVRWIWTAASDKSAMGAYAIAGAPAATAWLHRTITIPTGATIKSATFITCADDALTIWINGQQAAEQQGMTAPAVLQLGKFFVAGRNSVAIKVVNGSDKPAGSGLLGKFMIALDDGTLLNVPTDDNWHALGAEVAGWNETSFDDTSWPKARITGIFAGEEQPRAWEHPRPAVVARYLRREFTAEHKVRSAVANVCGLGFFELRINGQKIGSAALEPEAAQYSVRAPYVTYDITSQIKPGANSFGVILGAGRASELKLRMQIDLQYDDGKTARWMSDEFWKATAAGPIRANTIYDGENYDARMELTGWDKTGFNDSSWDAAALLPASNVAMSSQMIEPVRVTDTLRPIAITNPQPGIYIFDMGQNMVGWCRLNVKGAAGTQIRLRHAETLRPDGMLYTANLRGARATDTYILNGQGAETWEPHFTYHGFRYVEVSGFSGKPDLSLQGRVVNDDVSTAGTFECSSDLLNQIHKNITWGVRGNYSSMPTDCPQRDERQGWLGDRAGECKGEADLFDIAALYSKWLGDIRDCQKPNGSIPDVAPQGWVVSTDGIVWPSAYIMAGNMLYEQYGDLRILQSHYDAMKKWVDFTIPTLKDGIVPKNQYGDWCVPPESPELIHSLDPARQTDGALLSSAYFYEDLHLMGRAASLLGKEDDARQFAEQAEALKGAFNRHFFDATTGKYSNDSQTSSVLPLAFGIVPPEEKDRVFKNLVDKIVNQSQGHIGTGLVGGQWLMRVLSDNGRADLAYTIASQKAYPSWGYMISKGATTIWELWNGDTADPAMNSGNHVMLVGDLNIWMHEYLLGIAGDPAQPGYKHIIIRPHPVGDLTSARGYYQSPYGKIGSEWTRQGNRFTLNLVIPPNTTATVYLPTTDTNSVTESGRSAQKSAGIKFVGAPSAAVFDVTAGSYKFRCQLAEK